MKHRVTLKYKSKNENEYLYDDCTGMVINWNALDEEILTLSEGITYDQIKTNLSKKYDLKEIEDAIYIIKSLKENYGAFYRKKIDFIDLPSDEELLLIIRKYIVNQLTLSVTNDCNLRCKYCIYSDHYTSTSSYSNQYMSKETAKKAIDYFCSLIEPQIVANPFKKFSIGFYGGETLMNMDVIKYVINYIKELKYDDLMNYSTTTNGILLNEDIIKFFCENNVNLLISLDGNKKENDRLRVNINGDGTYDNVVKNINIIKDKFPEYYEKCVKLTSVFDYMTDIKENKIFFEECERKKTLPNNMFINPVSDISTNYYEQFSGKDIESYINVIHDLNKDFITQKIDNKQTSNYLNVLIGNGIRLLDLRDRHLDSKNAYIPYSGTCFPGQKLFVDYKGEINICEKVNRRRPIGNIYNGLDIKTIKEIIEDYKKYIIKECYKCPVSKICMQCFQHFEDGDNFKKDISKSCALCIKDIVERFSVVTNILEENPKADIKMGYFEK